MIGLFYANILWKNKIGAKMAGYASFLMLISLLIALLFAKPIQ